MDTRAEEVGRYWDGLAAAYDAEPDHGLGPPQTRAAWRARLGSALPSEPADVIDLACGTGSLTLLAAELGHRVTGVDLSPGMLAAARRKADHAGVSVRWVRSDVADLPADLVPGGADVVLARHILWTLPDPPVALARWRRLLRPAGRFVLIEGVWTGPGDSGFDDPSRMPWSGGVDATTLTAAVEAIGMEATVLPLTDPDLWGQPVSGERYLLVARPRPRAHGR